MGARQSNLSTTSSPNLQPATNAQSRRSNGTASGSRGSSHNTNSHGNPNPNNLYNQVDNEDTDLNGGINHILNPLQFIHFPLNNELKCPLCSKTVLPDDAECHFVMCITKPRISYNEDTLTEYKGECVICLEDLDQGNIIARLPCLCIYHKKCIDSWFEINRSCPEHPSD